MQYTALYRKLRPDKFSGVIGQEHIIRTLKNQIQSERVSHAYLFCGTRGTGKTTVAKIFAKAINCENMVDGEPCGGCRSCEEIAAQISMNVIEIDGASNNGVDNIRDIREEVKYPPVNGKYKVYIIDEVHMLSTGAFNALLKTLEEPPAHVVFILATTDPQKIPATIHSRCQRFDFRRVSVKAIADLLKEYMENEKVEIDYNALCYIALIADGSMRDALSILDQCISFYYGEKITLEMAKDITGSVDNTVFFEFTNALINKKSAESIAVINDISMKGRDISQFVTEFIIHLRNLLIMITAPNTETTLDFSGENAAKFLENAENIEPNEIIEMITMFSKLQGQLKYASNDRILLEVACIQQSSPKIAEESRAPRRTEPREERREPEKKEAPKAKEKAVPDDFKVVLSLWDKFIDKFEGMEAAFLKQTKAGYLENEYLYIVCEGLSTVSMLKRKEQNIKDKLFEMFGKDFDLNFIFKEIYNESHKKQYGAPDEFAYKTDGLSQEEIEKIKKALNIEISVV